MLQLGHGGLVRERGGLLQCCDASVGAGAFVAATPLTRPARQPAPITSASMLSRWPSTIFEPDAVSAHLL